MYALLINTCDKFEDCWEPFFKLFSIYWPNFQGKIYLNTEYKEYSYPGLDIISVKGCEKKKDAHLITWSECLIRALNTIEEDIVLYMQEDYFLKDYVKNDIVEKYVQLMKQAADVHAIYLTDQSGETGAPSAKYDKLVNVISKQRYKVNCQAGLWQKEVLLSYLRPHENAWQFEEFGSKRSAILKHHFYAVDKNWVVLNKFEIIPYVFTGIIGGMWKEEVVPLFEKHGITINYSKRGFVATRKRKPLLKKLEYQLHRMPVLAKSYLEILQLKWKN